MKEVTAKLGITSPRCARSTSQPARYLLNQAACMLAYLLLYPCSVQKSSAFTSGSKYELPRYVLSNPTNLRDNKQQHPQQVELIAGRQ